MEKEEEEEDEVDKEKVKKFRWRRRSRLRVGRVQVLNDPPAWLKARWFLAKMSAYTSRWKGDSWQDTSTLQQGH